MKTAALIALAVMVVDGALASMHNACKKATTAGAPAGRRWWRES
jgi:hypothetical protein